MGPKDLDHLTPTVEAQRNGSQLTSGQAARWLAFRSARPLTAALGVTKVATWSIRHGRMAMPAPLLAQNREQGPRQWHEAILGPLATMNVNHQAWAVIRSRCKGPDRAGIRRLTTFPLSRHVGPR